VTAVAFTDATRTEKTRPISNSFDRFIKKKPKLTHLLGLFVDFDKTIKRKKEKSG